MKKWLSIALLPLISACNGGYSFVGGDVGDAETVTIDFFPNYADLVKPQFSQVFTETLRDIFVQQTSLELSSRDGDMHVEGSISRYRIEPINAQASENATVAQNRLTVDVKVIFTNRLDEEKSFEKSFSRFVDFDANEDINAVEDQLHEQVSQELAENILNAAIGDW